MELLKKGVKEFVYILYAICIFVSCSSAVCQRSIILLLDMIPFCDRIHFTLYIKRGLHETQVQRIYGQPRYIFLINEDHYLVLHDNNSGEVKIVTNDTNTYTIQIPGYDSAPYLVTNMVYVYFGGFDAIAYIYIDSTNVVENVYIGGS